MRIFAVLVLVTAVGLQLDAAAKKFARLGEYKNVQITRITQRGIQILHADGISYINIENLSDPENQAINHHLRQAMHAHGIMKRDVDYVVNENGVMIVDSFTGRLMPGRRYSDGLHQAIEAKERVQVQKENKTLATITFQNYFRMYRKLSGMTGTALTEESEFREIYQLDVVEIPTNMPMIRKDHPDAVYRSMKGKYDAIVERVRQCHDKGQPVLVGTVSIDKSELLSALLKRAGIPHTVLNAKYHAKEAEIVAAIPSGAIWIMKISMMILPLICILIGFVLYQKKFKIDEKLYAQILADLEERNSLKAEDSTIEANS